jgi:hypothetical protein
VHLVLECLCVIWWLTAFSWLASWAAVEDWAWSDNCIDGICYKVKARSYNYTGEANATKAGAALGAINWILFCGTLITYGIYLHRHRRGVMEARQMGVTGNAVHEEHKMGPVVTQQPVYVQPTGYAQPTGYNQVPVDPRYQQVNMA